MTTILIKITWPSDYHYFFFHPILTSYEIYFIKLCRFWESGLQDFYLISQLKWLRPKPLKCPSPIAFRSNGLDLISIIKTTIAIEKWKKKLFPFKCLWKQNWPCRKIGQGQLRVIIYLNFVVLQTLRLHAKFQGYWPSGSWEVFLLKVLSIFSMVTILVMWPWPFIKTFVPPFQRRLHIRFGFDLTRDFIDWTRVFREEDVWNCEWTYEDGRRRRSMGIL